MTENTAIAKAIHKLGCELKYETPLGDYEVKITLKMPQEMPDELWDRIHNNFDKLTEVAGTIMEPN